MASRGEPGPAVILRRAVVALVLLASLPARTQDALLSPQLPSTEQRLAASCTNCHGPQGQSRDEAIATLAGRPAAELKEKLRAFREPGASDTVMAQIARAYTEDELRRVADYFSRLPAP